LNSTINKIINTLPNGHPVDVRIGAFWTAVTVEINGQRRCGLASALRGFADHHYGGGPAIPDAGQLLNNDALQLACMVNSNSLMEASVGVAAINALLPHHPEQWVDMNAEQVIAKHGAGKKVVIVGHFPFIPKIEKLAERLWVLEKQPRGNDLPAEAAAEILPQADVIAITGTTLINQTFEGLIQLCNPQALTLTLGPSTPLSPLMFERGIHLLSGSIVEDIDSVVRAVSQGANFRQIHRQGVRLVTMQATSNSIL
jgi:uncharacterized protein (DUF4213/DUF364 family)